MILRWVLILLFFTTPIFALQDFYSFEDLSQKKRFDQLTTNLRCLVCQNQNLAESNAPLAIDLRNQIYLKINEGMADKEIINYLVERYGNFILYRPPLNMLTFGLWFGPILLLITSVFYLFYYIYKQRR